MISEPINVLYVSHYPHMRMGGQRSMAALIENLDRSVVRPYAVTTEPGELSEHLRTLDCPVFHIPLGAIKPATARTTLSNICTFRKLFREHFIHIVHPDSERDAFVCGLATKLSHTKMVWHVRLTNSNNLDSILQRLADGIIGISDGTKQRFDEKIIAPKYQTIYNGINTSLFAPPLDKEGLRITLGFPADRFVILFVGQIKAEKGVFELVEAMALLRGKGASHPTPLLALIGTPLDTNVQAQLQSEIDAKGLGNSIVQFPQQENIHEWMQGADALILPSYEGTEGMGRVLQEAMGCGTVVIGTNISGIREAISPGSGLLVPEKSPEAIANAVAQLMGNQEFYCSLRQQGIARAHSVFNIHRHARNVTQYYRQLLAPIQR